MSHILSAVEGSTVDKVKVQRALLSVSDKEGIVELAQFLVNVGVELLSTGGTAAAIRNAGIPVKDVSEYTQAPEMMDGRVKTLHPKVHGGLLYVRGNAQHELDATENGVLPIDLVVLNLYPFEVTVAKGADFDNCIENIDIGGPSMLRSASKNHRYVVIASAPSQYAELISQMTQNEGCTDLALRRRFAARAFALSASYDSAIAGWINGQLGTVAPVTSRLYHHEYALKYGCNPHQSPAGIYSISGNPLPFRVVNGTPGYINLLDACNAWQLVKELRSALDLPAATSFKHVSPAGAGLAIPLSPTEIDAYDIGQIEATPLATAYLRARNADPMSSFGDFVAVSDIVDEATALILKREVSDGIIAPGYEPEALAILTQKKGGKFIVLEASPNFQMPPVEYREVSGMTFVQKRNDVLFTAEHLNNLKTQATMPPDAIRDLVLASITVKYTQSNSVGFAKSGQMVGVGAGQQSRVDCVKLAARKVGVWWLRQHPKVMGLDFKAGVKRQDRVNARVRYIEGDITEAERPVWESNFNSVPEMLSEQEKTEWLASLADVSLSSDAFFPFRDSIDHASKVGVKYLAQPGGSVADDQVVAACNEYGMAMAFTEVRLFHH